MPETAQELESYVVVRLMLLVDERSLAFGVGQSLEFVGQFVGVLVVVPQYARPKTAGPVIWACGVPFVFVDVDASRQHTVVRQFCKGTVDLTAAIFKLLVGPFHLTRFCLCPGGDGEQD